MHLLGTRCMTEAGKWTPLRLRKGRMPRWIKGSGRGEREAPPGKGGADREWNPLEGDKPIKCSLRWREGAGVQRKLSA